MQQHTIQEVKYTHSMVVHVSYHKLYPKCSQNLAQLTIIQLTIQSSISPFYTNAFNFELLYNVELH
jgi:hypothetical protein